MKYLLLLHLVGGAFLAVSGNKCSPPVKIDNGSFEYREYAGWPGAICHIVYVCDNGFKLNGSRNLYCYHDEWIGTTPKCDAVTCPALEAPSHGSMVHIENAPDDHMDSIVEFSCDDDYELDGVLSVVCLPDGSWSAEVPTCVSTKCHANRSGHKSCLDIKSNEPDAATGMYTIYSHHNESYTTYCEMETDGGGWTLVASIHENDMSGKCTAGDRWSSESGRILRNGNTFWDNEETYGDAENATIDDYKNKAYFELNATQLMLMQVPNGAADYLSAASFQYTSDAFLGQYGGNLPGVYKSYPIKDGVLGARSNNNGPFVPIHFTKGTAQTAYEQYGDSPQTECEPGFLQFRVINYESGASAFCPYGKMIEGKGNYEHMCFGTTRANSVDCGDFSSFDYSGWSTKGDMINSAFLILYR